MAALSVIRKLQRCECVHSEDDHHVLVKHKIKIKESASLSSSPACTACNNNNNNNISMSKSCSLPQPFDRTRSSTWAFAELTDSLVRFSPATSNYTEDSFSSPLKLQSESPLGQGGASRCSSRSPLQLQTENLHGHGAAADHATSFSSKRIAPACCKAHQQEFEEETPTFPGACSKPPRPKMQLQGGTRPKRKSADMKQLHHFEEEEVVSAMLPWKLELQEHEKEEEEDMSQLLEVKPTDNSAAPGLQGRRWLEQKKEEDAALQQQKVELKTKKKEQPQQKKMKMKEWEVLKIECECCAMEEECTRGYEERVRRELCGHWLCGLCQEAVREERQRLGGRVAGGEISLQAALQAHMQPCRRFSSRARAKAPPLPSAVAVPHAVCRLLRRHLSTPSPSPRPCSLPRCSSCLPSFDPAT